MKIVMLGPVYPYKTGLSYYVSLLYRQLKQHNDVKLFSYSMQYPKLLYRKPQKDYKDDILKLDDIEYALNTANPFSCLSLAKRINELKADLVIFQWLHPYFAPCYSLIARNLKKVKVLFMCHNVFPHERFPLDRELTKVALRQGDYFTVHSQSDADDLTSILPNANVKVTVHPAYNFFKQQNLSMDEAREILHIEKNAKVLLFFGLVREYKGLKHLIEALGKLKREDAANTRRICLLIAGDFAGARSEYDKIICSLGLADWINITDGHIPIGEVEKFFAAANLVVLPYESATQSGVVQVAYCFEKPVLATKVGGLPDVVFDGKTGYLVEPFSPDAIADAICDFIDNDKGGIFTKEISKERYKYSWEKMEEVVLSFGEKNPNAENT